MNTPLTTETLPQITYKNTLVVTTETLANLYGTEKNNIQVNHSRNAERFEEGKHYYKLEGGALRAMKRLLTESKSVRIARSASSLILWTERGAARHAKMLETDQAWEVFEKLEDGYFNRSALTPPTLPADALITTEQRAAVKQLVQSRVLSLPAPNRPRATIKLWSAIKNHFGRSYKEIKSTQFTEALSIAAGLSLDVEIRPAGKLSTIDDRDSVDNVMLLTDANYRAEALDYVDDLVVRCSDFAKDHGIDMSDWIPVNYEKAASGLLADLMRNVRAEVRFNDQLQPVFKVLPPGALYLSPTSDEAMRGLVSRTVSTETLMLMMAEGLARLDRERKTGK